MSAPELLVLADRVEREEPSVDFWYGAVYPAIHGGWPQDGTPESIARSRFISLCQHAAWRDAAAMLMPSGWRILVDEQHEGRFGACVRRLLVGRAQSVTAYASGPNAMARAWLAANLRAHAADLDKGGDHE